ncbi:MAG: RNHCP domain-containing protein [Bacilli bacterium]
MEEIKKKFTMIDEDFFCSVCGEKVTKLGYTARDHCPFCLTSMHVDNFPGDRESLCKGILLPIGIEKYKDTFKIVYKCSVCGIIKKNIMARDDDMDKIIQLSKGENK